jgi:uncharacterized membrane protein
MSTLPSDEAAPSIHEAPSRRRVLSFERMRRAVALLGRATARLEALAVSAVVAGATWVPWLLATGLALGGGVWALAHPKHWSELFDNKLAYGPRLPAIPWLAGGVLLVTLFVTAAHLLARRRAAIPFPESARRWGPRLAFLFLLPLVASLLTPEMQKASGATVLLHCALGAAAVLVSVYSWIPASSSSPPASTPEEREILAVPQGDMERSSGRGGAARWAAFAWVASLWLAYSAVFSQFALVQHRSLATRTMDLGFYDNIFYQSVHGRWLGCSFIRTGNHAAGHFDPILILLSPLYLIYPRAEFLLVLQSLWVGSGVIPVYLIARRRLGSRLQAGVLGLVFLLQPALHGANMYEFHSLSLLAPLLIWLLFFLEKGSSRGYFIVLPLLLLCREDASLLALFVGLAAVLAPSALAATEDAGGAGPEERARGEARRRRMGVLTIATSVAYFLVVKLVFMKSADLLNEGKDAYSFTFYYEALIPPGSGTRGLFLSILGNPLFVVRQIFTEPKLVYLATVFLPVLFVPLLVRSARVVLFYGLAFILLASRGAVFSTAFHYSTLLYPVVLAFTPAGLAALRARPGGLFGRLDAKRLAGALVPAALAASVLVSWQFGAFVPNGRFHAGYQSMRRVLGAQDRETYAWVRSTLAAVPDTASVSTTDHVGAHVSNRRYAYAYPGRADADYLFLDEGDLKETDRTKHQSTVAKGFKEIARRGNLVLYQKSSGQASN